MLMYKLYNPNKKGTLILAGPRYGSHFLAQVVVDWLPADLKPVQGVGGHSEIGITEQRFFGVVNELDQVEQQLGYQTVIVNDQSAKMLMIAKPELFENWHIVRIIQDNKTHWFRSFWYFLLANDAKFQHHGTDQTVYHEDLSQQGQYTVSPNQMMIAGWNLNQTLLNQYIDCDEHIHYEALPKLETSVSWMANQYPDVPISEMFTNGTDIELMLKSWPLEVLSKIR